MKDEEILQQNQKKIQENLKWIDRELQFTASNKTVEKIEESLTKIRSNRSLLKKVLEDEGQ